MKIILLRHGESEGNVKKQFCGFTDVALTEKGRAQGEMAALYLGQYKIDEVISSPLERAYETALLASRFDSTEIQMNAQFKEMNFGKWEGLTLRDIQDSDPELAAAWFSDYIHVICPGGESFEMFYNRIGEAYDQLKKAYLNSKKTLLLSTHSGVIRSILAKELSGSIEGYWKYKVENCGFAILEYDKEFPILLTLNNDSSRGDL